MSANKISVEGLGHFMTRRTLVSRVLVTYYIIFLTTLKTVVRDLPTL